MLYSGSPYERKIDQRTPTAIDTTRVSGSVTSIDPKESGRGKVGALRIDFSTGSWPVLLDLHG
jgi:hypothetical protein